MKLSEEQIEELYVFTRRHFVEHYDLQTELVDHLANGIESQWEEFPSLTFNEALQKEFKKFGICGFNDVIEDKRKAMAKKYRKYILRFYKEYFRLPKVLRLIALTVIFYFVLQLVPTQYKFEALSGTSLFIAVAFIWHVFKRRAVYPNKIAKNKKRWMMEEMIANYGNSVTLGMFPMYIFNLFSGNDYPMENVYLELGICAFFVAYMTLCYVMVFVIPKKAKELLTETYPEYKMA